jgi:hypothetical protein
VAEEWDAGTIAVVLLEAGADPVDGNPSAPGTAAVLDLSETAEPLRAA